MKKSNPRRKPFTKAPPVNRTAPPPAPARRPESDDDDGSVAIVSNTPADSVSEMSGSGKSNKWIGIYIAVLAVLLAVGSIGGNDASKNATRANIEASNTWSFFQAKTIRMTSLETTADELQIMLLASPALPEPARKAIEDKIASYKRNIERYKSEPYRQVWPFLRKTPEKIDPTKGEGRKELSAKAKKLETERDFALAQDPYFDWGSALLQIAIVLASASIIAGGRMLVAVSGGLAMLGTLLLINGFVLIVNPLG